MNDTDLNLQEIVLLQQKIENSKVPDELKERVSLMLDRVKRIIKFGGYSLEFEKVSKYIDWIVSIPWDLYTQDNIDLQSAKQIMDHNHYGMDKVKEMILDYLAVMQLQQRQGMILDSQVTHTEVESSSSHAPVLCFVGLQGVGKTTMAKSIAQAMGRKFVRIPLGALSGVSQLRGVPKSSPDAEPGMIMKALINAGSMNPLILLDEIDKTSGQEGLRSDMMAFLLEVLDPQQNSHYTDYYIDYPVNLSKTFFITTANTLGTISTALLDRLEVIRFTSYTDEEKIIIAKQYLLPKVLRSLGLTTNQVTFADDVWPHIVRPLGFDAGVRQLERNITKICRRVARKIVENNVQNIMITIENVREYLPVDVAVLT